MEKLPEFWAKEVFSFYGLDTVVKIVNSPEFEKARRVHEWRNYIPKYFRVHWKELSLETRLAIYFMARQQAHAEEWE